MTFAAFRVLLWTRAPRATLVAFHRLRGSRWALLAAMATVFGFGLEVLDRLFEATELPAGRPTNSPESHVAAQPAASGALVLVEPLDGASVPRYARFRGTSTVSKRVYCLAIEAQGVRTLAGPFQAAGDTISGAVTLGNEANARASFAIRLLGTSVEHFRCDQSPLPADTLFSAEAQVFRR